MKRSLVDAAVLLPLFVPAHAHHQAARRWFDGLEAGETALCRLVQLAVVRLLGNPAVMKRDAVPAGDALRLLEELVQDERVDFLAEPPLLDSVLPAVLAHPVPAHNLVTDAYLAAFAIASSRRLVTFDKGFRQFRGLSLHLL
jgi:uncharacterized protein